MSQEEMIFKKIDKKIGDFEKYEDRIIAHVQSGYFPLIYQCLYERIIPAKCSKFSTENFKILLDNNYLRLLNDIYRTRLSKNGLDIVSNRLQEVNNFDDYKSVLHLFEECNPIKYKNGHKDPKNAFSLGTKVLHTYNPEENPILDSVVRKNLRIGDMNQELCLEFKKAMNRFANGHEEYFSRVNHNSIKDALREFHLKPNFPKMKLLDMAILYKPNGR